MHHMLHKINNVVSDNKSHPGWDNAKAGTHMGNVYFESANPQSYDVISAFLSFIV